MATGADSVFELLFIPSRSCEPWSFSLEAHWRWHDGREFAGLSLMSELLDTVKNR
ncbi:hypothetical protein YC2023_014857 [Brassica napus]